MSIRLCPKCGSCKAAAALNTPRLLVPGDYIVCGVCMAVLRLDDQTMPVLVTNDEIDQMSEETVRLLAVAKCAVAMMIEERQWKASLN